jgi:eukaryotic-like serine/threonine-protein kinase
MMRMGDDEQSLQDGEATEQPAAEEVSFVDPWVGQYLADYYIIRRIGEGGMGIVYLARHQSLDRLAAVKFLGAHMVDDKAYIERFLNEARGAAKLNHPNIVGVYDAGSIGDNIYYFIMEYIEGRDLGSLLRDRHVFPVPESVGYIRQAAVALGYAHKKRIIHRDIKPDNLMLTNEGTIKVGDLGLAKWISDDGGGMTQSGIVMGTPYYISPEQVRGSRDVDARSDIYSLGASLHHMVTGRIPYEGTSPAVIMAMHLNNPVPEPNIANASLDADICALIKKMMAKKAEDRFQTMEEVDAALSEYQAGKMRSAQFFVPGGSAPLAVPPETEMQQLPSDPPVRLRSPVIIQTEPGAPVKIASIIGVSIVAAAIILGFFITSVLGSKSKEKTLAQASTAPEAREGFIPHANRIIEPVLPTALPEEAPKPAPQAEVAPAHSQQPQDNREVTLHQAPAAQMARAEPTPPQPPQPQQQPFTFMPEPSFGSSRPEGTETLVLLQSGETRRLPPEMEQEFHDSIRDRSYYGQNFSAASSGILPKGVEVSLIEPGMRNEPGKFIPMGGGAKKKEIQVGPAGYRNRSPRCEAGWSIERDEKDSGRKYLKLWHNTEAPQWILGVKLDLPQTVRNKKFLLSYVMRAGGTPPNVQLNTLPEGSFMPRPQLTGEWKRYAIPMPMLMRSELKSILVGIQGSGELHLADVQVVPPPEIMNKMFDKPPGQRGQQPNQPGMGYGGMKSK